MKGFAFLGLLRRYLEVWRYYWKHRHKQKVGFFNQQEAEFLPSGLSLQENPDSPTLKWTGRVIMMLVISALAWAIIGEVDIMVNADGKIIPSSRTKTIASIEIASVKAIHVSEGQYVKEGDILVELNSSSSDSEHDKAHDAVSQAILQRLLSQTLLRSIERDQFLSLPSISGVKPEQWQEAKRQLEAQYQEFQAKLSRINHDISHFSEALPLVERRAKDYKTLMEADAVSYHAFTEKEQEKINLQAQLQDAYHRREELVTQTRRDLQRAIIDSNKIIESAQQDQRRSKEHSKLLKLCSPVEGTVQQLKTYTVGGIVPVAEPLMHIVPKNNVIEVEAFLENKDIGFVQVGQIASVKVQAFDYDKYGTIKGRVHHVSKDAIQDEKKGWVYSVKILLFQNSLKIENDNKRLLPGMSVSVDIKTGSRRVIEYLLSPLVKHGHEALRER